MANKVEHKSLKELEAMHTGSLMSRRKALFKCDDSFEHSDELERPTHDLIQFKQTPEWQQAYSDLKSVLSRRENIPSKKERKELRQENALKGC